MPEETEEPPVDAAVVGTAAAMDPSGTTLIATVVAGAVGVVVGAGRRVVRTFRPDRPADARAEDLTRSGGVAGPGITPRDPTGEDGASGSR